MGDAERALQRQDLARDTNAAAIGGSNSRLVGRLDRRAIAVPRQIVPDLLEVLRVMTFRAHCHFKDVWREPSIDRNRPSQRHVLWPTITWMLRHLVDVEAKARVPFKLAWELKRECLDLGIAEARIEDERLHVDRKAKRAMHVRFDVVVEAVPLIRDGEFHETRSRSRTERGRVEAGIGKAKSAARRDLRPQPQMRGAEARGRSSRAASVVERADLRALSGGGGVVRAAEETSLPVPSLAPRVC